MRGRLFPTGEDWYEWRQTPPLAGTVHVHVAVDDGGRRLLGELRIDGVLSVDLLDTIPLDRIEAAVGAELAAAERGKVGWPSATNRRPRPVGPRADDRSGWEMTEPAQAVHRSSPLRIGPQGRPDTFYRDIANVYRRLAIESVRPALDIANGWGVPASTAHRWVKEARRRGMLPPGRPGRSG